MLICQIFTDAEKAAIIGGVFSVIGFLLIVIVQNNLIKRNQFESTFFNLLSNIREMSNSIRGEFGAESQIKIADSAKKPKPEFDDNAFYAAQIAQESEREIIAMDTTPKGQEWFAIAVNELNEFMEDYFERPEIEEKMKTLNEAGKFEYTKEIALQAYNDFQGNYSGQLWQYFRFIFNVIKFVDESKISNKKFYMNFIQSQMSQSELTLWFYNGIWPGGKKFYEYTEKYNDFLQNLDTGQLYAPKDFVKFYPNHNFRDNY